MKSWRSISKRATSHRLYRVHEEPDPAKVEDFAEIVSGFGLRFRALGNAPGGVSEVHQSIEGRPEERMLSYLMLRSFKQARYSAENIGHFGLASDTYTHFTSPIRRYPDLVVHRILKAAMSRRRCRTGRAGAARSDRERIERTRTRQPIRPSGNLLRLEEDASDGAAIWATRSTRSSSRSGKMASRSN